MKRAGTTMVLLLCLVAAAVAATPAPAKQVRDGRLDPGFGKGGKAMIAFPAENAGKVGVKYELPFQYTAGHLEMAPAPGGKIVVAGGTRLVRLLANGKADKGFGSGGVAAVPWPGGMSFVPADAAVDSLGRVLVAGSARPLPVSSTPDPLLSSALVMRFSSDGSLDPSFDGDGMLLTDLGIKPPEIGGNPYKGAAVGLRSLVVDSANRPLLTGGSVTKIGCPGSEVARSTGFVARLTEGGALDGGFGEAGLRQVAGFTSYEQGSLLPGGGLFAVGLGQSGCESETASPPVVLAAFGPEGNLDSGFGFGGFRVVGYRKAPVAAVASSGKIVLLGAREGRSQVLRRLLPNGATDPSFARGGKVILGSSEQAYAAVAFDKRERLLLAGQVTRRVAPKSKSNFLTRSSFLLTRVNPDSSFDRSFGRKGSVRTGFGGPSSAFATQVMVDPKGHVLVGGGVSSPQLGTGSGFALARYLAAAPKKR